jgi:hypothetical protein
MSMRMPADPFMVQLPSRQREIFVEDLRTAWRDACGDLRLAYLAWQEATSTQSRDAFAVYLAAADRETAAALAVASPPSADARFSPLMRGA